MNPRYQAWGKARGMRISTRDSNLSNFLGLMRAITDDLPFYSHPGMDHICWWVRAGETVCLTTEPYDLGVEAIEYLQRLVRVNHLTLVIESPEASIWNPDQTWFVQLWKHREDALQSEEISDEERQQRAIERGVTA